MRIISSPDRCPALRRGPRYIRDACLSSLRSPSASYKGLAASDQAARSLRLAAWSLPRRGVFVPIAAQVALLGQIIEVVAAIQGGAAVPGKRPPGHLGPVAARAGEEGIEGHREVEPLVEAALAEVVAGIGPGAPGAHP